MQRSPIIITTTKEEDGLRLDRVLKNRFSRMPFGLLQKAFRTGKVYYNDKRIKQTNFRVSAGATVTLHLTLPKEKENESKEPILPAGPLKKYLDQVPEWILHQDSDILVLNKPAGLSVQAGTKTTFSIDRILKEYAKDHYTPRITHRLDKETSGIVVFAKSRQAARHMTELFKEQKATKIYWACCVGKPENSKGLIDLPIGKLTGILKEKMSSKADDTRPAITSYRILDHHDERNLTWLELSPKTGRTHQIRVHCAESGFPLLGDGKYGGRKAHPFDERSVLCLHAQSLSFQHPKGHILTLTAPVPAHINNALKTFFPNFLPHHEA